MGELVISTLSLTLPALVVHTYFARRLRAVQATHSSAPVHADPLLLSVIIVSVLRCTFEAASILASRAQTNSVPLALALIFVEICAVSLVLLRGQHPGRKYVSGRFALITVPAALTISFAAFWFVAEVYLYPIFVLTALGYRTHQAADSLSRFALDHRLLQIHVKTLQAHLHNETIRAPGTPALAQLRPKMVGGWEQASPQESTEPLDKVGVQKLPIAG